MPLPTDPAAVETAEDGETSWRAWVSGLAAVRDGLGRLPAVPAEFWLGGVAIVALWYGLHVWLFRRRLRHAEPAPRPVMREVTFIAKRVGLARPPQTWMTDQDLSPLIWCGRRTRLILPTRLWSQLDRRGRRAILTHELAHLRRRDHWVRHAELVVSAMCLVASGGVVGASPHRARSGPVLRRVGDLVDAPRAAGVRRSPAAGEGLHERGYPGHSRDRDGRDRAGEPRLLPGD